MTAGMRCEPLSAVGHVFNGKTPAKEDQREIGHPVLKIRDVDDSGQFRGAFQSFVEVGYAAFFQSKCINFGDTLILNAAHNADYVGSKQFFAGKEVNGALATGEWLIVRPEMGKAEPRYVHFWLTSAGAKRQVKDMVKGIHLYPKDVARLEIPLPPLPEQRRIAAILDKADALRRKRKRAIELLDEAETSLVSKFLDASDHIDLGQLIIEGPTNGLYKPSSAYGDGTPILRINNFYDGEIVDIPNLRRLAINDVERKRFGLSIGDIVINRVNSLEYLGKSALVEDLCEPTVYESNMMRFAIDDTRMLAETCIALLQTPDVKRQILAKAKNAVNQSSINQTDVREIRLPLPSMTAQLAFKAALMTIKAQKRRSQLQVTNAGSLFSSLQHRAFSGQL